MLGAVALKHSKEKLNFQMNTLGIKTRVGARTLLQSIRLFTLPLLLILVFTAANCVAQTSKGIIAGVITDNTGAVVVGAHVTAKSTLSGETRSVVSGQGG